MRTVAALFVMADSIYKTLPGVECYDAERDALTFKGGCPVVAHPPCRTWGHLKAFATKAPKGEHALGPWAVEAVRRCGGVLEHPKGSGLFRACGCPKPGDPPDKWGGWTLEVDQFHFGHKARKRTLLYIVGTKRVPPIPCREGEPTHVVDRNARARITGSDKRPWITHKEREATPVAFARWLVKLARSC